jgi:dihydroorotate dehydrogenase (NAD+) catalytic subunit
VTRLPLWAKLSPNVTSLGTVARAVAEAGADGVTVANTFVGLCVDIRTRRSRLAAGTGGLSGPAIRPLALARVREAVRAVTIPVVGCGGITTAEDALEFLVVGARAVQVGTASFRDPRAARSVVEGIEAFLRAEGLASVEALIGTYLEGA